MQCPNDLIRSTQAEQCEGASVAVDPKVVAVIDAAIKKSKDEAAKLKKLDDDLKGKLAKLATAMKKK